MRWRTFDRLVGEHDDAMQCWVGEIKKQVGEAGTDELDDGEVFRR